MSTTYIVMMKVETTRSVARAFYSLQPSSRHCELAAIRRKTEHERLWGLRIVVGPFKCMQELIWLAYSLLLRDSHGALNPSGSNTLKIL